MGADEAAFPVSSRRGLKTFAMEIKRIHIDELEEIVPLFDAYRVFYRQPSDPGRARRFLFARVGSGDSVLFAALNETGYAGFTQLYPIYSSVRTVKNWLLNDLYVAPDARRKGVAEALIRGAMDFARGEGALVIRLETEETNLPARRVYERLGFETKDPDSRFLTYERPLQ